MVRTISCLLCIISFSITSAPAVELDFPLYDFPYNQEHDYRAPSMNQSLALTKDFYRLSHEAIQKRFPQNNGVLISLGFDILASWLPFGDAWIHEEWHRAVMGRRGIDSYNEVYEFQLFAETISVSDVEDAALIALKAEHPAEIVRLHAAGMEAQTELNHSMERDQFFSRKYSADIPVMWLNYLNNLGYLSTCASSESDSLTSDFYSREDQDISKRDFTGLDCNAWVYDLFRPTEPYAARGTHPSGVGIDRYITYSELTVAERAYLKRNVRLALFNIVNPFLFGRSHFGRANGRWNMSLQHYLTSFGYNLGANVFVDVGEKFILTAHYNRNRSKTFPGLELRWYRPHIDIPVLHLDELRLGIWSQPEDQSFYTHEAEWGGMLSLRSRHQLGKRLDAYWQLSAKTSGWLAGSVYLGPRVELVAGLNWSLWKK